MTPADDQPNTESEPPLSAEERSAPTRRQLRQRQERRSRRNSWIIFLSVLVVVLAIVMFFVYSFSSSDSEQNAESPEETTTRNPSPGLDGIIVANVSPENFLPGDCLADYTDAGEPADIVECSTPHNAQLVGRQVYSTDMSYPGEDELLESSEAFCADIPLLENTQATYSINTSRPSQYTWENDADRRIDCVVSTNDETNFTESLVEEPAVDDQRSEQEQSEDPIQTADEAVEAAPEDTQDTTDDATAEETAADEETTDDAS